MTDSVGGGNGQRSAGAAASSPGLGPQSEGTGAEQRYRLVIEHSADIIVQTRYGTIEWVSPSVESVLGWTPAEVVGTDWISLTTSDDGPTIAQARIDEMSGDTSTVRLRLRRKEGDWAWVDVNSDAVLDDRGHFDGVIVSIVRDVQIEVETDLALQRSSDLLASSQRLAKVGAWEFRSDGSLFWTDETYRLLDTTPEEFHPSTASTDAFYTPVSQAIARRLLRDTSFTGEPASAEMELITATGRSIWVSATVHAMGRGEQVERIIGTFQDITERRRADEALAEAEARRRALEYQLREAQQLEAVGALARAIAHDFSNVLVAVMGNADLARGELAPGHPARDSLDRIDRAGAAARGLIQRLLSFSRTQPQRLGQEDLRAVIDETVDLLRASLTDGVVLEATLPLTPVSVLADRTQIGQVVMNLCVNAIQAAEGSPTTVRVALDVVTDPALDTGAELAPGPYAHLLVSDTGSGMDRATRERIFEPFFTTKPDGQGTGLGLGIARSIVEAHHGTITVVSTPGQGSFFHVFLPLSDPAAARRSDPHLAA